jgi:hypothetical protein
MRRVEYHERKRVIGKWEIGKIGDYVWVNLDFPFAAGARLVRQCMNFPPIIHKHGAGIAAIEPKHAGSATCTQNGLHAAPPKRSPVRFPGVAA